MNPLQVFVSPGELFDRLTILRTKISKLGEETSEAILKDLEHYESLARTFEPNKELDDLERELEATNYELWELEDLVRTYTPTVGGEAQERFVATALAIFKKNEHRSQIKRKIDLALASSSAEEKVYIRDL